jgi:Na+:H+ antiporter
MNLDVFLSLFSLMLISLAVFLLSKKLKLPYTVLLVIAGSLLVPISHIEFFSFITSFDLTPELLFFVFLPILIFESAYNMNIRYVTENCYSIGLLAVVGLLISTLFIGVGGFYAFDWVGFHVPMLVLLLFGAIISSTDPVAVLALFKEYGAPHRLTLIFEGESLFNDSARLSRL